MREKFGKFVTICLLVALAVSTSSCVPDTVTGATAKPTPVRKKTPPPVKSKPKTCLAKAWLKALSKADVAKTIELAAKLAGPVENASPNVEYAAILAKDGVPASFLTAPLNQTDFKLWYYAWLLKKVLADNDILTLKSNDEKLKATMKILSARIARKEDPKGPLPWPAAVWGRRYGLCDRMAWLFAEFAYQMGFESRIVYLMDPDTKVSPHTICEIRGQNGAVWTADPYSGVLLTDSSVAELAANPKLMRDIWPKRPDWWKALPHSVCWIPAMPQDYRVLNQKLRGELVAALGGECPRFGEDPNTRLEKFAILAGKNDKCKTKLWFFPIRLMKMELEIGRGK